MQKVEAKESCYCLLGLTVITGRRRLPAGCLGGDSKTRLLVDAMTGSLPTVEDSADALV